MTTTTRPAAGQGSPSRSVLGEIGISAALVFGSWLCAVIAMMLVALANGFPSEVPPWVPWLIFPAAACMTSVILHRSRHALDYSVLALTCAGFIGVTVLLTLGPMLDGPDLLDPVWQERGQLAWWLDIGRSIGSWVLGCLSPVGVLDSITWHQARGEGAA